MADSSDPFYDPPIMTPAEILEFMQNLDRDLPGRGEPGRAHVMARLLVIEQHKRTKAWMEEKS